MERGNDFQCKGAISRAPCATSIAAGSLEAVEPCIAVCMHLKPIPSNCVGICGHFRGPTKTRPVSVVVYPQPALPSHVRDLPIHQQQQPAVSVVPLRRGSRSAGRKRPLSFVVVGAAETAGRCDDNPPRSTDDDNLLLLLPPVSGSPPPVYSPRRYQNLGKDSLLRKDLMFQSEWDWNNSSYISYPMV